MKYTVGWRQNALDQLADIWILAVDRQAVTRAVEAVDRALSEDPDQKGEDYYGDRLLVQRPLFVTYRSRPDDRQVEILDVWVK